MNALFLSPPACSRTLRLALITSKSLTVAVVCGLLVSGCGRKSQAAKAAGTNAAVPSSAAASPVNPEDSADAQEKARVAQAVAMRSGQAPPPPTVTLRGGEVATPEVLAAYNQRLAQLIFHNRDAPETLHELTTRWPMPALPTPPPGKRIIYDARNRIILLEP